MKTLKLSLLALVMIAFTTSCQKDEEVVQEEINYTIDLSLVNETDWELANEVLRLVNEHRVSQGLSTIKKDKQHASAYAVDHTKYMIDQSKISHDNFGVRSAALRSQGAKTVGENVAFGYTDAETLVHAWLSSPSHRAVIEGNYTHSGFGIVPDDGGRYYHTQLFYKK
ncbi:CAP domain-containing protein [Patiriisocius hiemis]|uniref:CAP domain-containing protein n=1 Tax=Patiriisocius hiemis TaxID=3075604 RepID=A0ABU2YBW7_9FLAO|nr:CAP domain-containing protein [Constantimarinum sp. W242]MDT0555683.1 CAP domain-containing protein [Constantimarinum sp. W242]